MRLLIFICLFSLFYATNIYANEARKLIREGNKLYNDGKYDEAEIAFRKALELDPESYKAMFNLGDALYEQGNYQEAMDRFLQLQGKNLDKKTLAQIYHNLGNSLFNEKKYEESIKSYINALRNNPKDDDTRYNLEFARRMLHQEQQQKQQQSDDNDENDNEQNQDQQQQNNDQGDENKEQDQQQQQDQQDQQGEQDEHKEMKQEQPNISKEDAERMLNALQNREREVQEKLNQKQGERVRIERNW